MADEETKVSLEESTDTLPRYQCSTKRDAADDGKDIAAARTASKGSRGSTATSTGISTKESFLIAAVCESRNRDVGICAIDLVSPYELLLWNVMDSHHYAESISLLHVYEPVEILVVETNSSRRLNEEISKRFSKSICRVVPLARKYFDQTKGAEDLKRVMTNRVDLNLCKNYVVMAAVACLMKYVEYIQGVYIAEKTMKVVWNASTQKLLLDYATISSLELVKSARGDGNKFTLFKSINSTHTSAGNRLLRSTLLRPSSHLKTIESRQEVIGLFLDNPGWFFDVIEQLPQFVDLDRLLGQLVVIPKVITPRLSRLAIANVIGLKHTLEILPTLAASLDETASKLTVPCILLNSITQSLSNPQFKDIQIKIAQVIDERVKVSRSTAQKRIQECFAVRAGIDGMLDVARRTYLETIEKIHEVAHGYKESMDMPLKLIYTARRGYHLQIPANWKEIPSIFVERVPGRKGLTCVSASSVGRTKELSSLNARSKETLIVVYKRSNGAIQELLNQIRPHASILYAMVESVALLDMLLSFTNTIALSPAEQPYVKPNLSEGGSFVVSEGRHAIVEKVLKDQAFIANNTFFDPASTFHLITGPNCAGKSTYLRGLAIITILAHMGCYVPAREAYVPLRDRIFTRFGTSDDMEENASTFAVEMTETAFILENCTARSLVLVDELGRGTSNAEGIAIAWAVTEELIKKRAFTCFATHYHDLNQLSDQHSRCKSYHMSTTDSSSSWRFRYKLKDGPSPRCDGYGIEMAAQCGLPGQIIADAERIHGKLLQARDATQKNGETNARDSAQDKPTTGTNPPINKRLVHHLLSLRDANLDMDVLRRQLQHLRDKYIDEPASATAMSD